MLPFQTERGKRKFVVCPFVYGETNGLKRLKRTKRAKRALPIYGTK